jgi:Secretion system C-terminal sorting domain
MNKTFLSFFSLLTILLFTISIKAQWVHNGLSTSDTVFNFIQYNGNLYAATHMGVFLSTDNGISWTVKNTGLGYRQVNDLAYDNNILYAAVEYWNVYRSSDNGNNWDSVGTGITSHHISSIVTVDGKIFVGTSDGIFISTDSGDNWIDKSNGLTNKEIKTLIVSGNNVLAGTPDGVLIYDSSKEIWNPIKNGPDSTNIFRLATGNNIVFAGTSKGIFVSSNDGIDWTLINDTLTAISSFAFANTNIFYGSTGFSGSVFRSSTNYTDWTDISDGIKYVTCLIISGNNFVAGTWGQGSGVWSRLLSQVVTGISYSQEIPLIFTLEQNYPNPFNPSTTIKYIIPNDGKVTLKVYDLVGRVVATLVNQFKKSGSYDVIFHARNLPSGVYFYQLRVDSFVGTKKFVLLK